MEKRKQSYFTITDRYVIEEELSHFTSFRHIAEILGCDQSAVSREVRRNYSLTRYNYNLTDCANFKSCRERHLCGNETCSRLCRLCSTYSCRDFCEMYQSKLCKALKKPPYVCNSCHIRCTMVHHNYVAQKAQQTADDRISKARSGVRMSADELHDLDRIVAPLIRKGQPVSHIYAAHDDDIGCSRSTLYNYIDSSLLSVRNIDLRRKVKYKKRRKKNEDIPPVPVQNYRVGRTYRDFQVFMASDLGTPVVQMDTVHGKQETGPCLLTLLFTRYSLMLIFLLPACTQKRVLEVIDRLWLQLGNDAFRRLFPVILTDNGPEFKNASAIETAKDGLPRTKVFYCDPMASWQKGAIEKNHEYIRYVIPKGAEMSQFSEKDIKLLENHINNTARPNMHGFTPYRFASLELGTQLLSELGISFVDPDDICLTPQLLK